MGVCSDSKEKLTPVNCGSLKFPLNTSAHQLLLPEQYTQRGTHSSVGGEDLALGGAVEFHSFKTPSHFLVLPSISHVCGVFNASESLFPDPFFFFFFV